MLGLSTAVAYVPLFWFPPQSTCCRSNSRRNFSEGHSDGGPVDGSSSQVSVEIHVAAQWISPTSAADCAGGFGWIALATGTRETFLFLPERV